MVVLLAEEASTVVASKNFILVSRVQSLLGAGFDFFVVNNFVVFCNDKKNWNSDFTDRLFSCQPHFRIHKKARNGGNDEHFSWVWLFIFKLDSRFSTEGVIRLNVLQDFKSGKLLLEAITVKFKTRS